MNKIIKSLTLLVLLVLLLAPARPAYAQSGGPGKIIFGDNYTLKSGEKLNGDLVVFGGNVTVESELGKGTCFIFSLPLLETVGQMTTPNSSKTTL